MPGRVKCGSTVEEIVIAHGCGKRKKANMRPGRGNSDGSWLWEEKKLICGPEGEIGVAHGRLPSPAPLGGSMMSAWFLK